LPFEITNRADALSFYSTYSTIFAHYISATFWGNMTFKKICCLLIGLDFGGNILPKQGKNQNTIFYSLYTFAKKITPTQAMVTYT